MSIISTRMKKNSPLLKKTGAFLLICVGLLLTARLWGWSIQLLTIALVTSPNTYKQSILKNTYVHVRLWELSLTWDHMHFLWLSIIGQKTVFYNHNYNPNTAGHPSFLKSYTLYTCISITNSTAAKTKRLKLLSACSHLFGKQMKPIETRWSYKSICGDSLKWIAIRSWQTNIWWH